LELFDTHCHIQSSDSQSGSAGEAATRRLWEKAGFPEGGQLVKRAAESNVTRMICVGCDMPESKLAIDFVQDKPACWASIGIHPHEAKEYANDTAKQAEFAGLLQDATAAKIVAIGECGLDYFYEHSPIGDQEAILRFQIELALKHNLPLIFHVREAFTDFWPIFDSYSGDFAKKDSKLLGVLHSFTDSMENMKRAVANDLCIGVNGIATFTKNSEQTDMYKNIPLSRLLLETDAPYLTPSPYRGNICEPYHTRVTAEFLAELRSESLDDLARATTQNAEILFKLQ